MTAGECEFIELKATVILVLQNYNFKFTPDSLYSTNLSSGCGGISMCMNNPFSSESRS